MENSIFKGLNAVNVNGHTESKNGLTYLSWAWAWAEVMKQYPDASYKIERNPETGLPYWYDDKTGYMCFTSVTINGQTREMWLPVMDGANKAMKEKAYKYTVLQWNKVTKQKEPVEKTCEAASMFDVNKTLMRCLVKNLAMFGLGLYIYAGEDLPEVIPEPPVPVSQEHVTALMSECTRTGITPAQLSKLYKVKSLNELTMEQYKNAMERFTKTATKETKEEAKVDE